MRKDQSESPFWPRIKAIIEHYQFKSITAFARHMGLLRADTLYQIKKGNNGLSRDLVDRICTTFPEVSKAWLLAAEGDMLRCHVDVSGVVDIPFYLHIPVDPSEAEPNKMLYCSAELICGAEIATVYRGSALLPVIKSGSVMFLKKCGLSDELIYGDVYYVCTEYFSKFRIVRRGADDGTLRLEAYSPYYDKMLISQEDITSLYHLRASTISG